VDGATDRLNEAVVSVLALPSVSNDLARMTYVPAPGMLHAYRGVVRCAAIGVASSQPVPPTRSS